MRSAREELEVLRRQHGGVLLPEQVVESARPRTSPLHSSFTWDDGIAAHKWRLHQARNLLRVYVMMIDEGDSKLESRMYVSLTGDRQQDGGYRLLTDVLQDADMRLMLLEDAKLDMLRFRQKYSKLVELSDVFTAMERTSSRIKSSRGGRKEAVAA